jgi:Ca2+-binding RTX toxin-like protein
MLPLGLDFILNSTITNDQNMPAAISLSDGRLFVAWRSYDALDLSASWIRGRFFDSLGSPVSDDFLVNESLAGMNYKAAAAALPGGGVFVTWTRNGGDGSEYAIFGRLLNADGSPRGSEFVVNTTTPYRQILSEMAVRPDGSIFVMWASNETQIGPLFYTTYRGRFFDSSGSPLGNDFVIPFNDGDLTRAKVTALTDGKLLVTCRSFDTADGSAGDIFGRYIGADGQLSGNAFLVNTTTVNFQQDPLVAALPSGKAIFVWASGEPTTANSDYIDVRARIMNADGSFAGNDFIVNSTFEDYQQPVAVTTLPSGRVLVLWENIFYPPGTFIGERTIVGRLLETDGTPLGAEFTVNTTAATGEVSATLMDDGRVFICWASSDQGDLSGTTVRGRYFAEGDVFSGTANNDAMNGSDFFDFIYGRGGDDTIQGGLGDDFLDGGAGTDGMRGGLGDDTYVIDTATDTVTELANEGFDLVRSSVTYTLGRNTENLQLTGALSINGTGNTLDNTMTGNNYANVLYGVAGNDKLAAQSGNDILSGGVGNDLLIGGAGRDAMSGGTGNDRFEFGERDTGASSETRDHISDFQRGSDLIDLRRIDANSMTGGVNDAFTFNGTSAPTVNGLGFVWYTILGNNTLVQFSTDLDLLPEGQIALTGVHLLEASDFVL